MALIFKHPDDETLYEQLISRLYHIERAFLVRRHIKLHYSKAVSKEVAEAYLNVRGKYKDFFSTFEETLLWFITVELWSRFTANSKKGLRKLVTQTNAPKITAKHTALIEKHKETIGYISTQRLKYFAHADDVNWNDFPSIHDKEYEDLIADLKELMRVIGSAHGSQMLPTNSSRPAEHTSAVFDDLLRVNAPDLDIEALSTQYVRDVKKFVSN